LNSASILTISIRIAKGVLKVTPSVFHEPNCDVSVKKHDAGKRDAGKKEK
jgi:hypothetical protein